MKSYTPRLKRRWRVFARSNCPMGSLRRAASLGQAGSFPNDRFNQFSVAWLGIEALREFGVERREIGWG